MTNSTAAPSAPSTKRRARPLVITLLVAAAALLVLLGAGAVTGYQLAAKTIQYHGVFAALPDSSRPAQAADGSTTYLMIGSNEGSPNRGGATASAASLELVTLAADQKTANVQGISAETPVNGAPVGEAFANGGPTGVVSAVESLTGTRVDHFGSIDYNGVPALVDAVGGIQVDGTKMNGDQARQYVASVSPTDGGTRVAHEQAVLKGLLASSGQAGPTALAPLSNVIALDDSLSPTDAAGLVLTVAKLDPSAVTFTTR